MLPLGRPVYLSDVSQIERRVSPHDFRKPGVDSTRKAPRVAFPPPSKKKGGEFVFLSFQSFRAIVSGISRVLDNNGPGGISAHAGQPTVRPPVEIVNGSSYDDARQISFPQTSFPRSFPLGEIYLPRKSTGGTLNSISPHEKKKRNGKEKKKPRWKGKGGGGKKLGPRRFSLSFCGLPVTYTLANTYRSHEILSGIRGPLSRCPCLLSDRERHRSDPLHEFQELQDFPGVLITIACTSDS